MLLWQRLFWKDARPGVWIAMKSSMSWRTERKTAFRRSFARDLKKIQDEPQHRGPSNRQTRSSMTATEEISYTRFMNAEYTAVLKQDGDWWIGWIEEIPGVNCQERTTADLLESLREVLAEAIEFNRQEACNAAGEQFMEERLAL
jgi:predicted RNase H-like HicB family nuclease